MILPFVASRVSFTPTQYRTPYLQAPGVAMISVPCVSLKGAEDFLLGFDTELGFGDYLNDPIHLSNGMQLVKFAGQLCYMSFNEERTWNKEAGKYLENIKKQGHGSVLEHANSSFLLWGVSRSFTHELVRHRAGFAYSQVSQRYVDGKKLRFVERPEFQNDPALHSTFERWIDGAASEYDIRAELLKAAMRDELATMSARDRRKAVNQAARSCLPNEAEAPIVVTGNVRAWRHFLNMRGSKHAEPEIRRVANYILKCFKAFEPTLWEDFTVNSEGIIETPYPKV